MAVRLGDLFPNFGHIVIEIYQSTVFTFRAIKVIRLKAYLHQAFVFVFFLYNLM